MKSWVVLFFQFWKHRNSTLLARWQINFPVSASQGYKFFSMEWSSLQSLLKLIIFLGIDKRKEKEAYQRYEWFGHLMQLRNNALIFFSIIFLQLSFELAYAHLYEVIESDVMR
ncbi:hypothetical protein Peur_039649 [Populus x canadensis]